MKGPPGLAAHSTAQVPDIVPDESLEFVRPTGKPWDERAAIVARRFARCYAVPHERARITREALLSAAPSLVHISIDVIHLRSRRKSVHPRPKPCRVRKVTRVIRCIDIEVDSVFYTKRIWLRVPAKRNPASSRLYQLMSDN